MNNAKGNNTNNRPWVTGLFIFCFSLTI